MRRTKPKILLAYEALLRNIDQSFRNREDILAGYYKQRAGYYGERQLDYKLSFLPKEYVRLPDIRLENPITAFQMDAIIITPNVIFITESKYLNGHVAYKGDVRQLIQTNEGKIKTFKDPILQAKIQQKHLTNWLAERGYTMPVEPLAVATNEDCMLECIGESEEFLRYFVTLENVIFKLEKLYSNYERQLLTPVQVQKLVHALKIANKPKHVDLLQEHHIAKHLLTLGIRCRACNYFLERTYGTWHCKGCNRKDKDAHKQKIYDYFLLIGDTITNEQCRAWLGLKQGKSHVAKRLLQSMGLERVGSRRHTKYIALPIETFDSIGNNSRRSSSRK